MRTEHDLLARKETQQLSCLKSELRKATRLASRTHDGCGSPIPHDGAARMGTIRHRSAHHTQRPFQATRKHSIEGPPYGNTSGINTHGELSAICTQSIARRHLTETPIFEITVGTTASLSAARQQLEGARYVSGAFASWGLVHKALPVLDTGYICRGAYKPSSTRLPPTFHWVRSKRRRLRRERVARVAVCTYPYSARETARSRKGISQVDPSPLLSTFASMTGS